MEDFKSIVKMKTGGSVSKAIEAYEKRERKTEMSGDMSQDKAMIKKGVKQHESALHKGEPKTELKLKTGGRAKKEVGTVKKYKCGGGVYGAKKTAEDKKSIAAAKRCKPKMASGGLLDSMGMGVSKPANAPSAPVNQGQGAVSELEKRRALEKMARAKKYLGPAQQSELIKQDPSAAGLTGNIGYKKGGKVKKCADGGSIVEKTVAEPAPRQNFATRKPTNIAQLQAEPAAKQNFATRKPMMKKGGKACK
jgi:hypothetical protein